MKHIFNSIISQPIGRYRPFQIKSLYYCHSEKQIKTKNTKDPDKQHQTLIHQKQNQDLEQYLQSTQKDYQIIERKYEEINVPGLENRNFTNLNKLQQQIIESNKFDLSHPEITPKMPGISSYEGVDTKLTEINLGKIKIKGKNQVFLSEVNPQEIPEDLDILFDTQKQLKIVGKDSELTDNLSQSSSNSVMAIQKETFEKSDFQSYLKNQMGMGAEGYVYSRSEKNRQVIFSMIIFLFLGIPVVDTLVELYECLSMISLIEKEKMQEINTMKQNNFRRVIMINSGVLSKTQ